MRLPWIILLFAFMGGYADAAGYLLTKTFTGHLTGNTVQMMIHLGQGAWHDAASNALGIVGFLVGTAYADWLDTNAGAPVCASQLRAPLVAEGVLFLAATGCFWQNSLLGRDLGVILLSLGLGTQNGSLRSHGNLSFHTTAITGASTSLLAAAATALHEKNPVRAPIPLVSMLRGILLAFASGAIIGGVLCHHFHVMGFAGVFVPWAIALLVASSD